MRIFRALSALVVCIAAVMWGSPRLTEASHPRLPALSLTERSGALTLTSGAQQQLPMLTGINNYSLATDWSRNSGCGQSWTERSLDQFFGELPSGSIVRLWFFQQFATHWTGAMAVRDWTTLDAVVRAARAHGVLLDAVLGNQDGTCDDGIWKGPNWLEVGDSAPSSTGFRHPTVTTSYLQWVHDVVSRYRLTRTVAIWEALNEPQAATCSTQPGWACWSGGALVCPDERLAHGVLRQFEYRVDRLIDRLDPRALIADGSVAGCGAATPAERYDLAADPWLDVVELHDYSPASSTDPSGLLELAGTARRAGKAFMVGEAGIAACPSAAARAADFSAKMAAAHSLGASAYLPWVYGDGGPTGHCDEPINPSDPTWQVLFARPVGATVGASDGPGSAPAGYLSSAH